MPRTSKVLRLLLAAAGASLIACAKDDTAPSMIAEPNGLSNVSTPEFDLLSSANDDRGTSVATDGNSYLVSFSTGNLGPGNALGIVRTFVVSPGGVVGQQTSTGRIGFSPFVAFDGTNYLLVWNDMNSGVLGPTNVFGQFIDPSGQKVGNMFRISTEGQSVLVTGLAFGSGHYLVTYLRFNTGPGIAGMYGKFVEPDGSLGNRFLITNPAATGALNNVATDGTDFLVVWTAGATFEAVKARLVDGATGAIGAVATLNSSPGPSDQPLGVAFNGGNYLVTWSDSLALHESNVYGRLVTAAGVATGSRISIAGAAGMQVGGSVGVLNGNFVVTWLDLQSDPANSTLKVRFLDATGALVGTVHTLFTTDPVTGKLPLAPGPVARGNDAFFVIERALPGPDPQSFVGQTEYDLHAAIRNLTP